MLSTAIGFPPYADSTTAGAAAKSARRPHCRRGHAKLSVMASLCGRQRAQEGEVAALVGAENLLRIELGIATLGLHLRRLHRGGACFQFRRFDEKIDAPFLHRKTNAVAAADEAERATR